MAVGMTGLEKVKNAKKTGLDRGILIGALLKMERIKQEKGQKEVCYGICVPSYLSKIEHGSVCADEKILAELFARLGIVYEEDKEILSGYDKMTKEYFYRLQYGLDTGEIYRKLKPQESKLQYSPYVIDWLLMKAFEKEADMSLLEALEEYMEPEQWAYYQILCSMRAKDVKESVRLCQEACGILHHSYAMLCLCQAYLFEGNYAAIHAMEQRIVAAAVEEGNTFQLADCFLLNGTAYACLNMEEMMMLYYERGIRLLQNTGWRENLAVLHYNIGATYISLKKYELALEYLEKAERQEDMQIDVWHKKAIAYLRMGQKAEAEKFLARMKEALFKRQEPSKVDLLKYEEAVMECEEGFLNNPAYLELLEKLISAIKKEKHFGHLFFYREIIVETYRRQRKYKQALEFETEISRNIIQNRI